MVRKLVNNLILIIPAAILVLWLYWSFSGMGSFLVGESTDVKEESSLAGVPVSTSSIEGGEEEEEIGFMVGGVQMNEGDQKNWIKSLVESGMNTVEVTVYAHQGRWSDNNLWFYTDEASIVEEVRLAKLAGLKVVMILRLQMDHDFPENRFLWHGMVYPETEYLLQRWFEEYSRFAKFWAGIAEREGIDVFMIGSEMNALFATRKVDSVPELEEYYLNPSKQKKYRNQMMRYKDSLTEEFLYVHGEENYSDLGKYLDDQIEANQKWAEVLSQPPGTQWAESHVLELKEAGIDVTEEKSGAINKRRSILHFYWDRLIRELRGVYSGKISAAANFDNYYEVSFWHMLDYIGINAYFPLRLIEETDFEVEDYEARWDSIFMKIDIFREMAGVTDIPVFFSELGYANHEGSTLRPWQGEGFSFIENSVIGDSLVIWKNQKVDFSERNKAVEGLYRSVKENNYPLAGILYWKFTSKEEQLQYDPFALHIGRNSKDSLPEILARFRDVEVE